MRHLITGLVSTSHSPPFDPATAADVALLKKERCTVTKTLSAVALALALGAAPVAFAQTPPHGAANRVEPYGTTNRAEEVIQSDQIRASKMIGSAVYDVQNRKIGKVRDMVLDRSGQIAAVVVDAGGFL